MPENAANADMPTTPGMPNAETVFGSGGCLTEVKREPGREYLAVRNQAKLTIKRSRHRVVREIAAKCPRTPLTPLTQLTPGMPNAETVFSSSDCLTEVKREPGREYLAVRNQAKLTIKRSRHRVVREIAAKCPRTSKPPLTSGLAPEGPDESNPVSGSCASLTSGLSTARSSGPVGYAAIRGVCAIGVGATDRSSR